MVLLSLFRSLMPAPPTPPAALESLFGTEAAAGFALAEAQHHGGDAKELLARAAEEASMWGIEAQFEPFLARYELLIQRRCSTWRIDRDMAASRCRTSLYRTWLDVGAGRKHRPRPQPFHRQGPYAKAVAKYAQMACHEQRRSEHPKTGIPSVGGMETPEVADEELDFGTADECNEQKWVHRMVLAAEVNALPTSERDVMLIRLSEMFDSRVKLSSSTVAQVLGKSNGAVDLAYHRAKMKLKDRGIDVTPLEDQCRREPCSQDGGSQEQGMEA